MLNATIDEHCTCIIAGNVELRITLNVTKFLSNLKLCCRRCTYILCNFSAQTTLCKLLKVISLKNLRP